MTIEVSGDEIRSKRVSCRLTQTELATRAGVDQGWLSKIERGRVRTISPRFLRAIEEHIGPVTATPTGTTSSDTP
ncbi:helix-turn-helix domain-containing protein [Frankia sp. Mgl5]|uniref:helix-turn-helix domain-containing protein n=1 Tax=Frankiaceae TaxID=74712 RepID=UPI0018A8022F|nr:MULTISPECIES: helix-turn-helix transcriptional regulator [Frankiaceae]MCK9928771.1 helix-turn-helix domain-containing protein [Frankia sp. Mgl5]